MKYLISSPHFPNIPLNNAVQCYINTLEVTHHKQFLCDTTANSKETSLANLFYKPENWSKTSHPKF